MAPKTQLEVSVGQLILIAVLSIVLVFLWWFSRFTLGVALVLIGVFTLMWGYFVLPRQPNAREWQRTFGFWTFSLSCFLLSAGIMHDQQGPGEGDVRIILAGAGLTLAISLALLWKTINFNRIQRRA